MNQRVPDASLMVKPGVTPSLLADDTVHVPGSGPSVVSGPRPTSAGVSGPPSRTIGEPARVGHLVHRVHVRGARADAGVAGPAEQVVREVVEEVDVDRLRSRTHPASRARPRAGRRRRTAAPRRGAARTRRRRRPSPARAGRRGTTGGGGEGRVSMASLRTGGSCSGGASCLRWSGRCRCAAPSRTACGSGPRCRSRCGVR